MRRNDLQIERRSFPVADFRVTRDDTGRVIIRGHAARFNSLSVDLGGFREKIAPGAFSKTLNDDVRALLNHNPDFILGRTRSGTLRIWEDRIGLMMEISPPNTAVARHVIAAIERGDISQASFGFRVLEHGQKWEKVNGETIRTLLEIEELYDVAPVAFPAYLETDVTVGSASRAEAWREALRRRRLKLVLAELGHIENPSMVMRRRRLQLAQLELAG